MSEFQNFMTDLAWRAGEQALRMQQGLDASEVATKASVRDIVTAADRATERLIRGAIEQVWPEHRFYGEETGKSADSGSPYCWIVDPIDGTVSYFQGQLYWCTSIALWKDGKPLAGAVYAPMLHELYYAEAGKGATVNGHPIHVQSHGALVDSVVSTGFSCLRYGWEPVNNLRYFEAICREARGVRRFGSAALDLCYVACGKSDAFWELNLQPYDVAAGVLIVTEAGGLVTDVCGGDEWPAQGTLATNPALQAEMLGYFKGYRRPEGK